MRSSRLGVVAVAVSLVTPVAAQGVDLADQLQKCAAIADSLQRLVCYDDLAKSTRAEGSGATKTAPAQAVPKVESSAGSSGRAQYSTRCQATTQKGTQCKRNAKPGSTFCWQHGG